MTHGPAPRGRSRVRLRLATKLVLATFLPTAVVLAAVALVAMSAYRRSTESLAIQRDRDLTRLVADQLGQEVRGLADTVRALTVKPALHGGSPEQRQEALNQLAPRLAAFDAGVAVLDAEGRVVAALPEDAGWIGEDWSGQPWYRWAGPTYSDVVDPGPSGGPVAILSVPMTDADDRPSGHLVGLFAVPPAEDSPLYGEIRRGIGSARELGSGGLRYESLYVDEQGRIRPADDTSALKALFENRQVVNLRLRASTTAYLIDSAGRAVYHTDAARIGEDLSGTAVVRTALASPLGALRTRDAAGRSVLASYASVPGTPWRLVTEESWAALTAGSRSAWASMLGLLALGVILPAVAVSLAVGWLTGPLRELRVASRRVAQGDLTPVVRAETGDEFEDLARQFNAMTAELARSYAELEGRVHDRTRELATLNAVAAVTSQSLDLEEILDGALERTMEALAGAARDAAAAVAGEAAARDPQTGAWRVLARRGLEPPAVDGRPLDEAPPLWSCDDDAQGRSIASMPAEACPDGAARRTVQAVGGGDLLRVPIIGSGRVIGALTLILASPHPLSADETSLLEAIGRQVGLAVDNAFLHAQSQRLAVLEERNRLARELHDSVTQALYAMVMYSRAAERALAETPEGDVAAEHVAAIGAAARTALQEMRLLLFDLRPPLLDKEGLAAALQARLDAVEGRAGLSTRLDVDGEARLAPEVQEALYSIAREALNNALKHAQARAIAVRLSARHGAVDLEIADDGVGFWPQRRSAGLGLQGMRERARAVGAHLTIDSAPGRGTIVRVEVNDER